jgi:5-methylcytosine-specific restriction enzyme A
MFEIGKTYDKNSIYEVLNVPIKQRKGAWDTGYREYKGNIFIFANVGIPGRTGHNYNNYWDGELFCWEAKTKTNIKQPLINKLIKPALDQKNYLFTRTNDKDPFTFEGIVIIKSYKNTTPVQIVWQLAENKYYPLDNELYTEDDMTLYEGSVKHISINKFERNPLARRMCIKHYGAICSICDFDFYKTYGKLGKGFIHVHHLVPLSQINKEYILDPINDLIPICPNCHSMIHRTKEMLSLAELKNRLQKNNLD